MCGRTTLVDPDGIEQAIYGWTRRFVPSDWRPRYNLNPREPIPVVHIDPESGERVLRAMHWNLIPGSARSAAEAAAFDKSYATFNARMETAATAPAFEMPWRRRRGLVVVDGIIEWLGDRGRKIPYWIRRKDRKAFAMAGLWDRVHDAHAGGNHEDDLWSCTVVVGPPDDWFGRYHNRMPRLLAPEFFDAWLDPKLADAVRVTRLLQQARYDSADVLEAVPISTKVNNPKYDEPDCLVTP